MALKDKISDVVDNHYPKALAAFGYALTRFGLPAVGNILEGINPDFKGMNELLTSSSPYIADIGAYIAASHSSIIKNDYVRFMAKVLIAGNSLDRLSDSLRDAGTESLSKNPSYVSQAKHYIGEIYNATCEGIEKVSPLISKNLGWIAGSTTPFIEHYHKNK